MKAEDKGFANEIYHVLIVGAGQIGAFYDQPGDELVLSHAHAFSRHPGFCLLGFVDQDRRKAEQAAAVWRARAFASMEAALDQERVDVVCLAVPDEYHFEYLKKLSARQVRLILAEKPLTQTWTQAQEIKSLFAGEAVPAIAVNYMRRFIPEFIALRQQIQQNEFGRFLGGTAFYGKGLIHNGSHLIDLLYFLLGEIRQVMFLAKEHDYYNDDPSISGMLEFERGGRVMLQAVDCRPYSVFEWDLFFEGKRLRMTDAGFILEEFDVEEDDVFSGYRRLEAASPRTTLLGQAMYLTIDNCYAYLTGHQPLLCNLADACRVMELCHLLQEGETA